MQVPSPLLEYVSAKYGAINQVSHMGGGDISEAYHIQTSHQNFLLKTSSLSQAFNMYEVERKGLYALAQSGIVKTPEVFEVNCIDNQSFILMEFVETQSNHPKSQAALGRQLAQLHSIHQTYFGWTENNYIGSLPQNNSATEDWIAFYARYRLQAQLDLAVQNRYFKKEEIPTTEKLQSDLKNYIGKVEPSLLHGDLWAGNYITDFNNNPVLIDPSVYNGHHEVDLAMSRLFGGFSEAFYSAYHEIIPQENAWKERQDLYQLYYLLVHLNLFGSSYLGSVRSILARYFK